MKWLLAISALMVWGCWATTPGVAQWIAEEDRYELGHRLRRFETAWQVADAASRERSVAPMESAVNSFFRLQLKQAGRYLDQAYLAVLAGESTAAHRWILSQRVQVEPRVADSSESKLKIQLLDNYEMDVPPPPGARVEWQLTTIDQRTVQTTQVDLTVVREGYTWETGSLAPGDYYLTGTLHDNGLTYPFSQQVISRVQNWEQRLQTLENRVEEIRKEASPTGRVTLRRLFSLLGSLNAGQVQETDYRACHLLQVCEALCEANGRSERVFSASRPGDYHLTLSEGRNEQPVRIRVPENATEPLPVLIAYHGAGGSENMFFEAYGAGRLVTLGAQRGWLVVAPQQGLFGSPMDCQELLDLLADHYPIDRQRVFLVGHSMGAAQVMSQVSRHPTAMAAAVALGGGRAVSDATQLKQVPWFVAAGERDFGRRGAQGLVRSLESVGAKVQWLEVPRVEHLVIVQAALDDVFKFLDAVAQSPPARE
jgi:predicted esterase